MARGNETDFLHNFRFHVRADLQDEGVNPLQDLTDPRGVEGKGEAGFNAVTSPEISQEVAEYRDGISTWTVKQPGIASVADLSLTRGLVRKSTVFLDWALRVQRGEAYRATLTILHWNQDAAPSREIKGSPAYDESQARIVRVHEAFPIRVKPTSDFDASSSDIAMQEIDVAYEWFEVDPQL